MALRGGSGLAAERTTVRRRRVAWWRAPLFGALIAYVLGYLPSTLVVAAEPAGATPPSEPPAWLTLMLAAALGMVATLLLAGALVGAIHGRTPLRLAQARDAGST